jgi:hypothetical protein
MFPCSGRLGGNPYLVALCQSCPILRARAVIGATPVT